MKKNTVLYLLLVVLIIMNGFFLFNYLGSSQHKGPKESGNFITSELKFNDSQLSAFKAFEDKHHENMMAIGDETKSLKDELFQQISAPTINQNNIDSLIHSISEKEILKEKELFNRLRNIYELSDAEQKEHFSEIIEKARRFSGQPPPERARPE